MFDPLRSDPRFQNCRNQNCCGPGKLKAMSSNVRPSLNRSGTSTNLQEPIDTQASPQRYLRQPCLRFENRGPFCARWNLAGQCFSKLRINFRAGKEQITRSFIAPSRESTKTMLLMASSSSSRQSGRHAPIAFTCDPGFSRLPFNTAVFDW